jgi:DNA invertase Pin-like site-specific DNA recombinase
MEAYSLGEKMPVRYAAERLGCSRQQVYNILNQVEGQLPRNLAKEVRNFL